MWFPTARIYIYRDKCRIMCNDDLHLAISFVFCSSQANVDSWIGDYDKKHTAQFFARSCRFRLGFFLHFCLQTMFVWKSR